MYSPVFLYLWYFGDVPKWLKGPHSKCGRSGNRRMGSNPIISAKKDRDLSTGAVKFGLFVCCERTALSHRRLLDYSKELTAENPT